MHFFGSSTSTAGRERTQKYLRCKNKSFGIGTVTKPENEVNFFDYLFDKNQEKKNGISMCPCLSPICSVKTKPAVQPKKKSLKNPLNFTIHTGWSLLGQEWLFACAKDCGLSKETRRIM